MSAARDYMEETLRHKGWSASKSEYSKSVRMLEVEHSVPSILKFPIAQFISDDSVVISNKPVQVTLIIENNQFFATSDSLNIFAVGKDMESVMKTFSQHVVYFFNYYKNKEYVVGDAVRLKGIFENNFNLID